MKGMLILGVLGLLMMGCDYTVSLVDNPSIEIDNSVVGLWQRAGEDGQSEGLLVLPLSQQEYMVSYPAGSADAIFARACFWRGSGMVLVQLEWFGTARGELPKDNRIFQYAAYSVWGDSLTVRLLNPQVIQKDIASPKALANAIAENKDHPNLFREEMVFLKMKELGIPVQ